MTEFILLVDDFDWVRDLYTLYRERLSDYIFFKCSILSLLVVVILTGILLESLSVL